MNNKKLWKTLGVILLTASVASAAARSPNSSAGERHGGPTNTLSKENQKITGSDEILEQIDIAPVWSVHRSGPPQLVTRDGRQYVAYYDEDRYATVAQRELGSDQWKYHRFPIQMRWATGAHALISIELDRAGYIHFSVYRRSLAQEPESPPRALYYRSAAPHSIDAFEHLHMITPEEHPHYPTYFFLDDSLFFTYRDGRSGRGNQMLNRYDDDRRAWDRALDTPLHDGQNQRNAYGGRPVPGPDGRFHALWVWRETPDHESNHSLSYARTVGNDLTQWESAAGVPVSLPFTVENRELLVDGTPPGGGLSNVFLTLAWDSKQRPVVSFHKFDDEGASQFYNARIVDGQWRSTQATDWDFFWGDGYIGRGAIGPYAFLRMGSVQSGKPGELTQEVWNRDDGASLIVLDEESLSPIRVEDPPPMPEWRQKLTKPESDFQVEPIPRLLRLGGPMEVYLIPDKNDARENGGDYFLRWENAGNNRDVAIPKPWPKPTMLRVYKIRGSD